MLLPHNNKTMSKTTQNILYFPLYALLHLCAWLPLRLLYGIGQILYVIIYRLIGYRKKVVRNNLKSAFPEKSETERLQIERQFYHFFADYIVETIKLLHISDDDIHCRMKFENTELINRLSQSGKSVILLLGHYGNWEWIPSLTHWCDKTFIGAQIYRPLKNKWFDRFFLQLRSRFDPIGIPKNETLRTLLQFKRSKQPFVTGFMADQTPSPSNIHHWTTFFGIQTAVLTGYETIARKLDCAVVYLDVEVVSRGHYKATFKLIEENPASVPEFSIADRYIQAMEQTIRRAPHAWLWTHKRWKHTPKNLKHPAI